VTVLLVGMAAGAVYVVGVVVVDELLKLPQAPALPQLTVQFTPLPSVPGFGSFVTVAATSNCWLMFADDGGVKPEEKATVMFEVIVMVADADALELVTDVAVIVTAPVVLCGTMPGAV